MNSTEKQKIADQLDRIHTAMHAGTYDIAAVDDAVAQIRSVLDATDKPAKPAAPTGTSAPAPTPVPGTAP